MVQRPGTNGGASKLPPAAWVCLTVAFVATVGAFAYLSAKGADSGEFSRFLNTVVNLATLLLGGGALAYAGQAAKQTDGDLDARIQQAVKQALTMQRAEDVRLGTGPAVARTNGQSGSERHTGPVA